MLKTLLSICCCHWLNPSWRRNIKSFHAWFCSIFLPWKRKDHFSTTRHLNQVQTQNLRYPETKPTKETLKGWCHVLVCLTLTSGQWFEWVVCHLFSNNYRHNDLLFLQLSFKWSWRDARPSALFTSSSAQREIGPQWENGPSQERRG